MKFLDIELRDFRKLYLNNDEFVIMIRDETNPINKNTKNDIVYYNGIKAFEIIKENNKIKNIVIKDNIYKINTTNVKKNSKKEIIDSISKARKNIKSYLNLNLNRIEFELASKGNLFNETMSNFKKDISEYIEKGYTDGNIKKEVRTSLNKKNETIIYFIDFKFNKNLTENDLKIMLEIEYSFIKNFKINKDGKEPYIIKNITYKFDDNILSSQNISIEKETIDQIQEFNDNIKSSIKQYELLTREELEKKYQHQFMVSKNTLNKLDDLKELYRFEEEYYTDESENKEEERGRIDCVFLKIDKDWC